MQSTPEELELERKARAAIYAQKAKREWLNLTEEWANDLLYQGHALKARLTVVVYESTTGQPLFELKPRY